MTKQHGFSILELIGVIAIVGILVALAAPRLSSVPAANLYANSVASQFQQARFEAIKRNRPVAVVWDSGEQAFITRANQSNGSLHLNCSAASAADTIRIHRANEYKSANLSVSFSGLDDGILWLPTGLSQDCGGGSPLGNISITGRNASYKIVVSGASRVRVERL